MTCSESVRTTPVFSAAMLWIVVAGWCAERAWNCRRRFLADRTVTQYDRLCTVFICEFTFYLLFCMVRVFGVFVLCVSVYGPSA